MKTEKVKKETLTATKIHEDGEEYRGKKAYFKLSHKIKVGRYWDREVNIVEEINKILDSHGNLEYLRDRVQDGIEYVCISDANDFYERLVFAAVYDESWNMCRKFSTVIDGVNTFITQGGDKRTMKPYEVYLRRLASFNGFEWGGIV